MTSPAIDLVFKICPAALWRRAQVQGVFTGAPVDVTDGFIHFSTAAQVRETARRHFSGLAELKLVTVATEALGPALKWEASRGGDLFPHLYGPLPLAAVRKVEDLPLGADGVHIFPGDIP